MSHRSLPYPVFDADNHMYETEEALTKFLPKQYEGLIEYVEVNGRTKIVVRRTDQRLHPEPDLRRVVAAPGAQEEYFRYGNPEGKSYREIMGEPIEPARLPSARAAARADGRAGHRPRPHVPDAGQPDRRAHEGRPRADPRRRSTRSTSGCTSTGRSTTRAGSSPPR